MRDRDLYAKILGIEEPWKVVDVELNLEGGEVAVHVVHDGGVLMCPECGEPCGGYDTRERRWRHLDTCQYRTILVAKVPRVDCPVHGARQVGVPWADPGSRFTALFEALIIDWLKEASLAAVSRRLGVSWDEASGVRERAVRRGLARRKLKLPRLIGVDETAFQKRHEYVTVVSSLGGEVLHVADGRGKETLTDFFEQFTEKQRERVEVVAMDMWRGYIYATRDCIPDADKKIAFDKFHVAQHLSKAVDKVRRGEHRELMKWGDDSLKGTRFTWLKNPANIDADTWQDFEHLRESTLRTARAWSYKELAMMLWHYRTRGWARRAWMKWYRSAIRSRLDPIKKVARMVHEHLEGIVTAVVKGVTNARAEGINSTIQWLKYTARGYRNRERFRTAIYFHLGALDLYPDALTP